MPTETSLNLAQQLYIAYYGRPADPAGLQFWASQIDNAGGDLTAVIAAFATSPESVALYGAQQTPQERVTVVFQNLLGRAPDPEGLAFYTNALNVGTFDNNSVILAILEAAQNEDQTLVSNKVAAATRFTEEVAAGNVQYNTAEAAAVARTFLNQVDATPESLTEAEAAIPAFLNVTNLASTNPESFGGVIENGVITDPTLIREDLVVGDLETPPPPTDAPEAPPVVAPPVPVTFSVAISEDNVVSFSGSAGGPITYSIAEDGTTTFSRGGVTAANTLEMFNNVTINLVTGQTIQAAASSLDEKSIQFNGTGAVNIIELQVLEATAADQPVSISPDVDFMGINFAETLTTTVGGSAGEYLKLRWFLLDKQYVLDGPNDISINEAFVRLGVDYVEFLEAGNEPFLDFIAKLGPTREQTIHDNLLGNLSDAALDQRFRDEPDLKMELEALIPDEYQARPTFSGNDADLYGLAHRTVLAFDFDMGWQRDDYIQKLSDAILDPSATKLDGTMLIGTGNLSDSFNIVRHEGAGVELAVKAKSYKGLGPDPELSARSDGVAVFTVESGSIIEKDRNGNDQERAKWSFDFSVATGLNGRSDENLDDYSFSLFVDIDPDAEGVSFVEFTLLADGTNPITAQAWALDESTEVAGGFSSSKGTSGTSVSQVSANFGFGFFQQLLDGYDYGAGVFDIKLVAYSIDQEETLAENLIQIVVPDTIGVAV